MLVHQVLLAERGEAVNPFDLSRPEYPVAGNWDRLVRVVRARDRMRARGYVGGSVDESGIVPVFRSWDDPDVWEAL